jgi:hypothetical protein
MEIHAPDKPILTLKEAAVHLTIVTVGILIALSLEGALEWRHHRALVREARANLATELRDNRRDLQAVRSHMDAMLKKLAAAADTVDGMLRRWDAGTAIALFATPGPAYVMYGYDIATPSTASHETAAATGALGFMEYAEVKKYAEVYKLQEMFVREQTRAADTASTAASLGLTLLKQPSTVDIDAVRRQLRLAAGAVLSGEQFADVLLRAYERALDGPQ